MEAFTELETSQSRVLFYRIYQLRYPYSVINIVHTKAQALFAPSINLLYVHIFADLSS
jgi:hypothetical protein